MIRTCKKHGEIEHSQERSGYWRCRSCASRSTTIRRQRVKARLVELFGGKCQRCGYNKSLKALGFHHKDSSTKLFQVSAKGATLAYDRLVEEAKKCLLLCANCHAEAHDNLE